MGSALGGFPEGYTIYTAIREQCRNLHHVTDPKKSMQGARRLLNRDETQLSSAGTYLETRLLHSRGRFRGPRDRMTR